MEKAINALFSCARQLHWLKKYSLVYKECTELLRLNDQLNEIIQPLYIRDQASQNLPPYYHWRKPVVKTWLYTQHEILPTILEVLSRMRRLENRGFAALHFMKSNSVSTYKSLRSVVFDYVPFRLFGGKMIEDDNNDDFHRCDLDNDITKVTLDFFPEEYWNNGPYDTVFYVFANKNTYLKFGVPIGQKMRLVVQNH